MAAEILQNRTLRLVEPPVRPLGRVAEIHATPADNKTSGVATVSNLRFNV